MINMKKRLSAILMAGHTELTELWLGFVHLFWGLYLLSPHWDPFHLPVYSAFAMMAPAWVWGSVSTTVGLLTIAALLISDDKRINFPFRRITLFANVVVWASITMAFFLAPAVNTGQIVYLMLAVLSAWLYIRLRVRGNQRP